MSRTQRRLDLLQLLRNHRYPINGKRLAEMQGISLRTLYRDIATLQTQGARIEGEAGLGYVLKPGYTLPPLMFDEEELEALVLGMRWVSQRADTQLAQAGRQALHKIASIIPTPLRQELEANTLLIGPGSILETPGNVLATLRQAIRQQNKLDMYYRDQKGKVSRRTVWPFALGYFEQVRMLVCWCELRETFRHFRTDRIEELHLKDEIYPQPRQALLKSWRIAEGIASPAPDHC